MNQESRIKNKKTHFVTIIHYSLFIIRKSGGFTLVELLIVLIILVAIGSIIGSILFSTLRGASKTSVLQSIRQNGNYAVLQMGKTIRNAKQFNGLSTDGINYITSCVSPPAPTPVPGPFSYVKVTSLGDQQTVFSCETNTIGSNGNSLLDLTSVTLTSCSITCIQASTTDSPTIIINFSLSQAGTGLFVDNSAKISFKTSVAIRNQLR